MNISITISFNESQTLFKLYLHPFGNVDLRLCRSSIGIVVNSATNQAGMKAL